ncbi:MAG: signal peptide peptidase SppA [Thermodesulfobacteriaceae bacterium]|nr:signal peptide peptidase SppA [Caldimicrobium sp.]MCX8041567.1 signal peptide peptidase SppA [Thermodesulfobacteriaceae bacterium]MDW8136092.1 signal peptide peptidase SppA [Thermodesulfobacterium sp.]
MKRAWLIYGLAFIGGLVVSLVILSFFLSFLLIFKEKGWGKAKIGVLEIRGIILDSQDYLLCIREFSERRDIKGVVVRIESPGGSVGAAQEILEELKNLKKVKPVVVSMGNIAASGGLYIALGGNKILASPGTITGSIGVIIEIPNIEKLLKKVGIESETIKSGPYKDTGSIYRPLTSEEKKYLQEKVNRVYEQFVKAISEERKIPIEKVKEFADGRFLTGEEAVALGLIDGLGNFWTAVEMVRSMANLKEATLIFLPKKKNILERFLEEKASIWYEFLIFKPFYLPIKNYE